MLKKEGTCWVNLGDTYISKGESRHAGYTDPKYINGRVGRMSEPNALPQIVPEKCLAQIPARFAIEMTNRDWILRNEIIWHKPNVIPSSVKDRFTVDFEPVFFFVKSNEPQYWVNEKTGEITDKQPKGTQGIEGEDWEWKECSRCKGEGCNPEENKRCVNGKVKSSFWEGKDYWFEQQYERFSETYLKENRPFGILRQRLYPNSKYQKEEYGSNQFREHRTGHRDWQKGMNKRGKDAVIRLHPDLGRNKRCVWKIPTQPFKEAHFAVFPEKLVEPMILAGCPENGIVLDPFFGAGTTGVVAKKFNRNYIGIELNPDYIKIAKKRLRQKVLDFS